MIIKDAAIDIGNRIKGARMLGGYNRISFSKLTKISTATLRSWESPTNNRNGLTWKGAERLKEGLRQLEIDCSCKWLMTGDGKGPFLLSIHNTIFDKHQWPDWGEEEAIIRDIESFKSNNPDSTVTLITDGSMLPFLSYGEYAGGCRVLGKKIKSLLGKNCIIQLEDKTTLVRKIISESNGRYTLSALNHDVNIMNLVLVDHVLLFAAEVIWRRRRIYTNDMTI